MEYLLAKIRDNLLTIGIAFFSITLLMEHIIVSNSNLFSFFKGLSSGLIAGGTLLLLIQRLLGRKAFFMTMLLISTCYLYSQTKSYQSGSLLWEISGKDLSKPSYLLGTFHLKSGDYLDSIPGAKKALLSCEQVVGELNMSDMAGMQMQMQQAMMMTPDTTYRMLYSDENYQLVSEKIVSLMGAGLDQIGMLKPAAIQLAITMLVYSKYFPAVNPVDILDLRIQAEATKEQKPVLSLETIDNQIYVLFGMMSLQRQADMLLCGLKNLDETIAEVSEIIDSYNQGDLNKLHEQMEKSDPCPSTPQETDALNKDRNNAWMKKLPAIMKEKSSFIAVGALHLGGEDGLLNLLEKEGYTVRRP
jgi:uncharacterized protein YbaP (TraB family)